MVGERRTRVARRPPAPTDEGELTLGPALIVRRTGRGDLVDRPLTRALLSVYIGDAPMWEHTRYTHPPVLAAGDWPIIPYRRWAAQFYE